LTRERKGAKYGRMEVEFRDSKLALIETNRAAETKLPLSVINSARRKLVLIRAAPDERTMRNWKSLHYEKMSGDCEGERSIRLNRQWRMDIELDEACTPGKVIVIEITNHYA
jgi:toxin HigB-1